MHTTITTDAYVRTVKGLSILDSHTFELQIDLGFGILHRHTVHVRSPLLDAGPAHDLTEVLREIFAADPIVVTVATEKPSAMGVPTVAQIFVNGERLELAVARVLAARSGEVAL
jgi:hypothetical protein